MSRALLLLSMLIPSASVAEKAAPPVTSERLAPEAKLPPPLKTKGKRPLGTWKFVGKDGVPGYLVLSSTDSTGKAGVSRQLFAQLYGGKKLAQLRLVQDGITNCKLDMTASFVQNSISFDDIDGDNSVEVGFAYDLGCDATERPTPRKLLVLEGANKYALRGNGRGKDLEGNPTGGDHKADGLRGQEAIATWAELRWTELLETAAINVDP